MSKPLFLCESCGHIMSGRESICPECCGTHMHQIYSEKKYLYTCDQCSYKFITHLSPEKIGFEHTFDGNVICPQCGNTPYDGHISCTTTTSLVV